LDWIPLDSVGVEIGVWKGDSSEQFLTRAKQLHLVDPWSVEPYKGKEFQAYLHRYRRVAGGGTEADMQRHYDRVYEQVVKRFIGKPVAIHRCTSQEFFRFFPERSVDWVYVDGLHTYEGCLADLHGAWKIIRPGGVLLGDDYGNKDGVTRAVDAFAMDAEVVGNQYRIQL